MAGVGGNPLDEWRQKSSFKPEELQEALYGQEVTEYKLRIWDTLLSDPLFSYHGNDMSLHEKRELTFRRMMVVHNHNFLPDEEFLANPRKFIAFNEAIQVVDGSLLPVYALNAVVGVALYCARAHW